MSDIADDTPIPIPAELLSHPALQDHPQILALHEQTGGIPQNADPAVIDAALQFANTVASGAVHPGTKTRRSDPSPRREARVWRSQLLGHRETSVSPSRRASVTDARRASVDATAAAAAATAASAHSGTATTTLAPDSGSPGQVRPARYRSRSRPPGPSTVLEEFEFPAGGSSAGGGSSVRGHSTTPSGQGERLTRVVSSNSSPTGLASGPRGRRNLPAMGGHEAGELENRVAAHIQQQHEFHDRLLRRFTSVEAQATLDHQTLLKRFEQSEARYTNKVNAYLGRPLVPVSNGREVIPANLVPLTSPDAIKSLPADALRRWVEYYIGWSLVDSGVDEGNLRHALGACTGVDPALV